jgi:predicted component of type VI protein secretion system
LPRFLDLPIIRGVLERSVILMKTGPWLLICGVRPIEWSYRVVQGKQTIGRSKECEIRVDHKSVSRQHAVITFRDRSLIIEDLKSTNGTFLNDTRVSRAEFHVGDTIGIGKVMMDIVAVTDSCDTDEETERAPSESPESMDAVTSLLSAMDNKVLHLLLEGLSEKAIADRLSQSEHTIHWRVNKRIYKSLGVHSRVELLSLLLRPER